MRGECSILLKNGEECGGPSVYSEPCMCDECDWLVSQGMEAVHENMHFCAEHYDKIVKPRPRPERDDLEEIL
jgi:hypothetical protein